MRLNLLHEALSGKGYKFVYVSSLMDYIKDKPGYCCADIIMDGLFYFSVIGTGHPLYVFDLPSGLVPWPHDDIVGLSRGQDTNAVKAYMAQFGLNNSDIPRVISSDEKLLSTEIGSGLVSLFEPGWIWTPKIKTGVPGESIVNAVCNMRRVDGDEMLGLIDRAVDLGLGSKEAFIREAIESGYYNLGINENIESDVEVDRKIEAEITRHRKNAAKFFRARQ
jgi:hypothetical protein